ncbi:hypothetical protein KM043_008393 [Ampulex compressa]|nr:hypothetical protein KM043_008393 [Ampulex compressa]
MARILPAESLAPPVAVLSRGAALRKESDLLSLSGRPLFLGDGWEPRARVVDVPRIFLEERNDKPPRTCDGDTYTVAQVLWNPSRRVGSEPSDLSGCC